MDALVIILPFVIVLGGLVWLRLRTERTPQHHAKTDDHIIEQPGLETGHSSVYRVTKDPQAYAKIFHK